MSKFFKGIENQEAFEGRSPRLGLGNYLAEVVGMHMRHSEPQAKDYLEVLFTLLESDSPGFPAGSEACIQIWEAPYNIHKRKAKALMEALLPGKKVTEEECDEAIQEDLLTGRKLRIKMTNNAKGYLEPTFSTV